MKFKDLREIRRKIKNANHHRIIEAIDMPVFAWGRHVQSSNQNRLYGSNKQLLNFIGLT